MGFNLIKKGILSGRRIIAIREEIEKQRIILRLHNGVD